MIWPSGSAPGQVIGLDRSDDVLTQAAELAALRGIENATFVSGNIYDLEFDDDTFDVVHAHQVLQHLTDPVAALYECGGCSNLGGIVAVRDADFHGMSWYPELPELSRLDAYLSADRPAQPGGTGRRPAPDFLGAGRRLPRDHAVVVQLAVSPPKNSAAGRAMSWSERVLHSAYAEQSLDAGCWTRPGWSGLRRAGWPGRDAPDAWFLIPNGEILARKP